MVFLATAPAKPARALERGMLTHHLQIGSTMFRRLLPLLLLLPAFAQAAETAPPREPLEGIVAIVNDDVITRTELDDRLRTIRQQLEQQRAPLPPRATLEKQVLDRMILSSLQLQLAERTGLRVDDETLNRTIARIAEDNRMSLDEFRRVLERDGYDFASFREDIRKEILISRVQQRQIADRVMISEQDVDNVLAQQQAQGNSDEELRLAHILVAVPDAASPERIRTARERAEGILQDLRSGADFRETAIATSDGQQALEGGDLGWRKRAELPTLFVDAVGAMQVGDVSELIRSPSGYHIIKLADKRSGKSHIVTQSRVRHILLRTNALVGDDEAEAQLEALREQLAQGGDFAAVARSKSEDPGSAANGGELGWTSPGELDPRFQATIDALAPGEISAPFKSNFGWHIAEVLERREHDDTANVLRSQARDALRQRKIDEELQTWLSRLRDEAHIENRLNGDG